MFQKAKELIDRGRRGEAVRIPLPFPKLSEHVGIAPSLYFYIGGDSGTGKSAFVHKAFIHHPYEWLKQNPDSNIKLKIFMWSLERPTSHIVSKWICSRLWEEFGILIDVPDILSWHDRLPDEIYKRVCELEKYFDEMEEVLEIIDARENPTGIYNTLRRWARKNGTEYDQHGEPITDKRIKKAKKQRNSPPPVWSYEPDDPNLITILLADHFGIVKEERGFTKKQNIDKLSDYFQIARDRYGHTPVGVSQFNRNIRDTARRTQMTLQPEPSDFEHSSRPYHDADVAIGLLNPHKYSLKSYMNYNVEAFLSPEGHNRFRTASVLKNSYGIDDINIGLHFIGENGLFYELPKGDELTRSDYYNYSTLGENGDFQDRYDFEGIEFT